MSGNPRRLGSRILFQLNEGIGVGAVGGALSGAPLDTQSVVPGPAVSAWPGDLLEMQILKLHSRPAAD